MNGEYVVYVLYSQKFDAIYVGYTSNLVSRFHSHNSLAKTGHTVKYRPWLVLHVEFFDTKIEALKREKALKSSRGRDFIRNKIIPELVGLLSVS
jgi:putative endonuclease